MTDAPSLTPRAAAQHAERLAREAQALRRNLILRKHQARARAYADATPEPATADPDAAP